MIKARTRKKRDADGNIREVGVGKMTIGRWQVEKTFDKLGLEIDFSNLHQLSEIRNGVEHSYSDAGLGLIREAIADAVSIIHPVIISLLKENPGGLLGSGVWKKLLDEKKVFENVKEECRKSFSHINWESEALEQAFKETARCLHCGSSLLKSETPNPDATIPGDMTCLSCNNKSHDIEDVAENALQIFFERESYIAATDGDVSPLEVCPGCSREAHVTDERRCVLCGGSYADRRCEICGNLILVSEYDHDRGDFCITCHRGDT
ncbi:MAG: hypothetical protein MPK62_14860 [Alphaproteobacteria bacterium]|nr:hypothetical protein [Alphaproteobacteria bacterium]